MGLSLRSLNGIVFFVAAAAIFPLAATAQPASSTTSSSYGSPADTFNRAYFKNDPSYFRNQSYVRQLDAIFGFRDSFPETEIQRDAELVDFLYQDVLRQQYSVAPVIRTRDLPNPYNTSILGSPATK